MDSDAETTSTSLLARMRDEAGARWPPGAAGWALAGLIVLGIALRILAVVSLRPTTILEDNYQIYAHNPFLDPLHPAGYGLILGAIGRFTRDINATILLQHLAGIASALLLYGATKRVTGSRWAGLLPAGVLLLDGDIVFLEHSIMSESWAILTISIALYATVRSLDQPTPWIRWPLLAGAAVAAGIMIRSATLPLLGVTVVALLVGAPRRSGSRPRRWSAPLAVAGVSIVCLLGFGAANAAFGPRFGIEPSPGWYLYARVAQFANCDRFTPPPGTAQLCQRTPTATRPSAYYYQEIRKASPALRLTGGFGNDDGLVSSWAHRALEAQFGDFLAMGWSYFRSYYVPSSLPARLKGSTGLDPQLSYTNSGNIFFVAGALQALHDYYGPFPQRKSHVGLAVLRRWQLIIRFGATALFATTILTLIGLLVGTRRSRFGVLLF